MLEKLGAATTDWKDHDTLRKAYGVPLAKVLEKAGVGSGGKKDKRCSPSLLLESMGGGTRALVVWMLDGKPLPKEQGDVRLVVTTDKQGARCVYQLAKIELADLPK